MPRTPHHGGCVSRKKVPLVRRMEGRRKMLPERCKRHGIREINIVKEIECQKNNVEGV
jgi:hypothetical protein